MAVFAMKMASRSVFRRAHLPTKQPLCKRQASSAPTKAHRENPKPQDDPASGTSIPLPNTVATLPLWQRLGPLSRGFQARTLRALVISMGSSIPSYSWFMFLGNNFNYASKTLSLATKVTVNQLCFTPIFNSYFFGMQSLLSGDILPDVWERIKRTVPTSMINSCKLWPAVTAFSFTFIDAQYRSIFAGFIAIGWQTYLSFLNRRAEVEAAEIADESGANNDPKAEVLQKDTRKQ
ncbi:hypothetical protein BUE80_DR001877 [Diplocarpon rosae]|nr:hypothetical protein BUE80_DR001877 [Diplocarpon rosae]